jgi:hypothetical protein
MKNEQCTDRLRFLILNPKNFIFMLPVPINYLSTEDLKEKSNIKMEKWVKEVKHGYYKKK